MAFELELHSNVSMELCKSVSGLAPGNPFYAWEYVQAKQAVGYECRMILMRENGRLVSGCPAYVKSGFLAKSLEVESIPNVPNVDEFWEGLQRLCQRHGVSQLGVYSSASEGVRIPELTGKIWRKSRCEYVIELRGTDLWKQLSSSQHQRKIKRSRKEGIGIKASRNPSDLEAHLAAAKASMDRRRARGEAVSDVKQQEFGDALLRHGSGELFQAVLEDRVLSSVLVIASERSAYYLWAGTTKEGMGLGASHFLIFNIATEMQKRGLDSFNLGGAYPDSRGLIEFKYGFGAREVQLEAAEFCIGSETRRKISRAVGLATTDPRRFFWRGMDAIGNALKRSSPTAGVEQ